MTTLPPPPPPMSPLPGDGGADVRSEHGPYTFVDAIKVCFSKFVVFKGRARRSEYWYWTLFTWLVSLIFGGWTLVPNMANITAGNDMSSPVGTLSNVVNLVLFLPGIAVAFRRLHDVNKSGGWLIAPLVCLVVAGIVGVTSGLSALSSMSDTESVSAASGAGLVAALVIGILGFALYIPILVWLCKDGGPNTPNKYGVRD